MRSRDGKGRRRRLFSARLLLPALALACATLLASSSARGGASASRVANDRRAMINLPPAASRRRARRLLASSVPSDGVAAATLAELRAHLESSASSLKIYLTSDILLDDRELPSVAGNTTRIIVGRCGDDGTAKCTLDGAGASRHVSVNTRASLTLENLVLTRGAAGQSSPWADGGAVFVWGTLVASDCSFVSNVASVDGPSGGGAVAVEYGDALFTNCAFTSNVASGDGGAIKMSGVAEVRECEFSDNVAGGLGTIYADAGSAVVRDSTFSGNVVGRSEEYADVYVGINGAAYVTPYVTDDMDDSYGDLSASTRYLAGGDGSVSRAGFLPPPPGTIDPSTISPPPPPAPWPPPGTETQLMGMEEVSERAKDGAVRNAAATGGALMGAAFLYWLCVGRRRVEKTTYKKLKTDDVQAFSFFGGGGNKGGDKGDDVEMGGDAASKEHGGVPSREMFRRKDDVAGSSPAPAKKQPLASEFTTKHLATRARTSGSSGGGSSRDDDANDLTGAFDGAADGGGGGGGWKDNALFERDDRGDGGAGGFVFGSPEAPPAFANVQGGYGHVDVDASAAVRVARIAAEDPRGTTANGGGGGGESSSEEDEPDRDDGIHAVGGSKPPPRLRRGGVNAVRAAIRASRDGAGRGKGPPAKSFGGWTG